MDAIDELSELSDSMRQAAALLADEDVDDVSSSKRPATFLNVVALGNTDLDLDAEVEIEETADATLFD
nr:dynamin-2A-like [Ipomoea batatas]